VKEISVVRYGYRLKGKKWRPPVLDREVAAFVAELAAEYGKYGITVGYKEELENVLDVKGYADLLNTVRLRTNDSTLGNPCLGHVIGQSERCDLLEDIRRGVSRVAFAPETIEPDGTSKKVCHNCGCGC
jgi:sugar phosphate isomerase/epimerase